MSPINRYSYISQYLTYLFSFVCWFIKLKILKPIVNYFPLTDRAEIMAYGIRAIFYAFILMVDLILVITFSIHKMIVIYS